MEKQEEKIILNTSDETAKFVTNIEGWVSRNGRFYGKDERLARWDGCTHIECETCGNPTPKGYLVCDECRKKKDDKKYSEMEKKEYNGEYLYSDSYDKWFSDIDEVDEFCEEENLKYDDLKLIIGVPEYAWQIDYNEMYFDNLPEDTNLEDICPDLAKAFDELNKVIKAHQGSDNPLSWTPGKYVPIFKDEKVEVKIEEVIK